MANIIFAFCHPCNVSSTSRTERCKVLIVCICIVKTNVDGRTNISIGRKYTHLFRIYMPNVIFHSLQQRMNKEME